MKNKLYSSKIFFDVSLLSLLHYWFKLLHKVHLFSYHCCKWARKRTIFILLIFSQLISEKPFDKCPSSKDLKYCARMFCSIVAMLLLCIVDWWLEGVWAECISWKVAPCWGLPSEPIQECKKNLYNLTPVSSLPWL